MPGVLSIRRRRARNHLSYLLISEQITFPGHQLCLESVDFVTKLLGQFFMQSIQLLIIQRHKCFRHRLVDMTPKEGSESRGQNTRKMSRYIGPEKQFLELDWQALSGIVSGKLGCG